MSAVAASQSSVVLGGIDDSQQYEELQSRETRRDLHRRRLALLCCKFYLSCASSISVIPSPLSTLWTDVVGASLSLSAAVDAAKVSSLCRVDETMAIYHSNTPFAVGCFHSPAISMIFPSSTSCQNMGRENMERERRVRRLS